MILLYTHVVTVPPTTGVDYSVPKNGYFLVFQNCGSYRSLPPIMGTSTITFGPNILTDAVPGGIWTSSLPAVANS